ncbi:MAG: DUF2817 domain-containing protein [Gammaproteobacteria bacterium HGW-Gammaproteobacteria-3]|nr:MAG: DUF2817 domain-containing protein [Gammaproteobacteria bacterium HGW-Gammaproteobacteria-3]
MPTQYAIDCFAENYFDARDKFLAACAPLPGQLKSLRQPVAHYENRPLFTDVFRLGSEQAEKVLIVISGTHGVEGFCGSAAQINWLRQQTVPDNDIALLFIHALNPYGFAHLRRVNEDNIDLNRNFIDFTKVPVNEGYRQLASVLLPPQWTESCNREALMTLANYAEQHGRRQTEEAVSGGQYQYADGLFYGGSKPSWSRRNIETLIQDYHLSKRGAVVVIDIHSGLGPYGYGELISDHPPLSPAALRARRWFGDSVTEPALGTSTSVLKQGLLDYAWHDALGDRGCCLTLEFGTYAVDEMFRVLREENYFRQQFFREGIASESLQNARQRLRDYFFPDKEDWKEMVLFRSCQVMRQALAGLKSKPSAHDMR